MEKTRDFMKKKSSYIIVLLIITIALQTFFISKNTTGGNVLNYKVNIEQNQTVYIVWNMVSHILKYELPEKANIVYLDSGGKNRNQLAIYAMGLDLLPRSFSEKKMEDYKDPKKENLQLDSDVDYILVHGEDANVLGYETEKQITLFRVLSTEEQKLEKVIELDFSLYSLYQYYFENKEVSLFDEEVEKLRKQVISYWDLSAIPFLYDIVIDAANNQNYELMKKHAQFYLTHVDFINEGINLVLGDYYFEKKEYEKAKYYYQICTRNNACDFSRVEKQIQKIEERIEGSENS